MERLLKHDLAVDIRFDAKLLVEYNPIFDEVIGAPNGNFPKEFGIEPYIDRKLMFEKTFHNPIKSLLRAANWTTEKISTLEKFFA